jgi:hypothetical protein
MRAKRLSVAYSPDPRADLAPSSNYAGLIGLVKPPAEIKDILSTNARLPGIYGVIVWSKQNNATGMRIIFEYTFTDSGALSLKAGEEHAELRRNE